MCCKFTRILIFIVVFIFCHYSDLLYASPFTPPVINNLNNDAVSFNEGNARVFLDAGGNAEVTPGSAPNFTYGMLTVEIVSGIQFTEDHLGVYNVGNAAGQIGVLDNEISFGGTVIATFKGGASVQPLKIRFNANATAAAITALLRQITYFNSNPTIPVTGYRAVKYLLNDGYGGAGAAVIVNLQVNSINHAPVVSNKFYVGAINSTISMTAPGLKYNDFDPDGNAMTFSPVGLPLHGSLSLSNSGSFSYTPDAGFTGLDSFTYRLIDPSGATSAKASALFFIGSTNVAPVTAIDHYTINQNEALYISDPNNGGVLKNDLDNNSGNVTIYNKASLVTSPAHGQITMSPNGTFKYLPNAGYSGTETFIYQHCDAQNACSNGTITIVVQAVNNAPNSLDDYYEISHLLPGAGNVLGNDVDAEGNALTASLVTAPTHGSLVLNANGTFSYTPDNSYDGIDRFSYQVCDNGTPSGCDTAFVVFNVNNENIRPVITAPASFSVQEDIAYTLNSISIADADAGSGAITALFEVATGSLAAVSTGGVTATGAATSALTLSGTLADINAFIAANHITYTSALNANGNVAIRIIVNDNGNTGTGGAKTDTANATLNIQAVNDAAVITAPATAATNMNQNLIFNTANGNLVTVSDVDAGAGSIQVTLTATHGQMTLPVTAGLSFLVGSGMADVTMTFIGSVADINNTLSTLIFTPVSGYVGNAAIAITVNDLGNAGTGGAQTASSTINVEVKSVYPMITTVQSTNANGTYLTGDVINVTVTFDQAVTVNTLGGHATLLMETGATDRQAVYTSGSGTNTITFAYTVQAGDASADLDYTSASALVLNGATIKSSSGYNAVITLPASGSTQSLAAQHAIVIDGIAPVITAVAVPANGTYTRGNKLTCTVHFSEPVKVTTSGGTPSILIVLDTGGSIQAAYTSGSGSTALTFEGTVSGGQLDIDGITLGAAISLNGGVISDVPGNITNTTLNNIGVTTGVLVDGVAPVITSITRVNTSPTNATSINYTVSFTENVTGVDASDFSVVTVNGTAAAAITAVSQVNTGTYTLTLGSLSGTGILRLAVNNSTNITDIPGNALDGSVTGDTYTIDRDASVITSVTAPANGIYRAGDVLTFAVNYNEPVVVNSSVAAPAFPITLHTGGIVYATYIAGSGSNTLLFNYTVQTGNEDADGIGTGTNLVMNTNSVLDATGNAAGITLNNLPSTSGILVDAVAPQLSITSAGSNIIVTAFTVTFTFTESVTGFDINDILVTNGRLSGFTAGNDRLYTVLVTPVADGAITINVPANNTIDIAGNGNQAAPAFAVKADITAPSVTLTLPAETRQPFTANIQFSEAVLGFTLSNISCSNALLSNLTLTAPGVYTVLVTPIYGEQVKVSIGAGVVTDLAGNLNTASVTGSLIAHSNYHIGKVYPNPASKYVYIKLEGIVPHKVNVRLTDLQGQIVIAGYMPVNNNLITVNVSTLTTGVYVLMVRTIGTQTFKILVSR